MNEAASDPYEVLGLSPEVSDEELRRVYRALVKRHHPDHNGGSPESTLRFARIQEAYGQVVRIRLPGSESVHEVRTNQEDPGVEQRIASLERELELTREAERRARAAQEAARRGPYAAMPKPSPEELGYYETDDTFSKILDDAGAELADRVRARRRSDFTRRLTDLFGGGSD
jgi:hypothetical protein